MKGKINKLVMHESCKGCAHARKEIYNPRTGVLEGYTKETCQFGGLVAVEKGSAENHCGHKHP